MDHNHWSDLAHLIIVVGHAVYIAESFENPVADASWCLQEFQKGEPSFYVEHIRHGAEIAANDRSSLLIFSGGQTRYEAGPRSEAQSYWQIADHFGWWTTTDVKFRTTTEEFAADSYQNLLFSICRFRECVGRYPELVTTVTWLFKEARFDLHRAAICLPEHRFRFEAINNPLDLSAAEKGEKKTVGEFVRDPYGSAQTLQEKRRERNPFKRQPSYWITCSEVRDLLQHRGPETFTGNVPWL